MAVQERRGSEQRKTRTRSAGVARGRDRDRKKADSREQLKQRAQWLKGKINAAKAELGLTWGGVADLLAAQGIPALTKDSLASKHSRCSFTAVELVAVLQVLGVRSLEVPRSASVGRQAS